MAPSYEKIPPYARIDNIGDYSPPVQQPSTRLILTETVVASVQNRTSRPMMIVVRSATWMHSFLFWRKTVWFPVVSVLAISFVICRGLQQLEVLANIMPTKEKLSEIGWTGALVMVCILLAWALYSVGIRWIYQKCSSPKVPSTPTRIPVMVAPTESSPETSIDPVVSEQSLDSFIVDTPEIGLLDGPDPSVDISVRAGTPRGGRLVKLEVCVFLVGECTTPLGEEICVCADTGEYMLMGADFVLGNKDRCREGERFIRLYRSHGKDYLSWFEQVKCMWGGCLQKGVVWDSEGVAQRWCPTHTQT